MGFFRSFFGVLIINNYNCNNNYYFCPHSIIPVTWNWSTPTPPPVRRFLLLSKHFPAPWSLHETQHTLLSFRISPIYFATQTIFFRGSWVPLTFFPATTFAVDHFPINICEKILPLSEKQSLSESALHYFTTLWTNIFALFGRTAVSPLSSSVNGYSSAELFIKNWKIVEGSIFLWTQP